MEYYTVVELADILGITDAALRQKIRAGELQSELRTGKISVSTQDFENYLHRNRCWNFEINDWLIYSLIKRPIHQQFVKIPGALKLLSNYGISIEQRTLKRWVHQHEIKAYNLGGTYYIPIKILEQELL